LLPYLTCTTAHKQAQTDTHKHSTCANEQLGNTHQRQQHIQTHTYTNRQYVYQRAGPATHTQRQAGRQTEIHADTHTVSASRAHTTGRTSITHTQTRQRHTNTHTDTQTDTDRQTRTDTNSTFANEQGAHSSASSTRTHTYRHTDRHRDTHRRAQIVLVPASRAHTAALAAHTQTQRHTQTDTHTDTDRHTQHLCQRARRTQQHTHTQTQTDTHSTCARKQGAHSRVSNTHRHADRHTGRQTDTDGHR